MTRRESKPSSESPDKVADNPYLMATMAEDTAFGLSRIGQISVNVHDLDRAADRSSEWSENISKKPGER